MEQVNIYVKINNPERFTLILNTIKELTYSNVITMTFKNDGIYFNDMNYLYDKNKLDNYICNRETYIQIDFFSINNTNDNVLYFISTKKEPNNFKIIEKYDVKTTRTIIKINNKRKLIA